MQNITRWFLVSYILGYRRCYLRVVRVFSMVGCKNISSFYWLVSGREVVWEVMPVGLLTFFVGSFSLTELTDLTELFHQRFELTEGLRHTEFTEAFQLRLAVTFCDIGWLDVSVNLCVFCSSVFFCEKKNAPSWEIERTLWMSKTLTISIGIVKIFQLSCSSLFIEMPSLKQKDALHHSRTCLSCMLKTPFLEQEEHVVKY